MKPALLLWFAVPMKNRQQTYSLLLTVSFAAVAVVAWGEERWIDVKTRRRLASNMDTLKGEQRGGRGRGDVWWDVWEWRRQMTEERGG